MEDERQYTRFRCAHCGDEEVVDESKVVHRLREIGKLRHDKLPEREILTELVQAAAAELSCPACGKTGLTVEVVEEDFDWPEAKTCEGCGKRLDPERLELFPDAELCPECQRREESGESVTDEVEYCPRCGSLMEMRQTRGAGVTRYKMMCTARPPCRS